MAIDRTELMTLDNLPPAPTPEVQVQFNMLKQLALQPVGTFRLAFFPLPADLRLHAKSSLLNMWQNEHEVQSISILEFTQELLDAIYKGTWISHMKHYTDPEILIIDDLQYLSGKESTQESLFLSVLKPRLEKRRVTILFSEYGYAELSPAMRDDLRNLLRLSFHNPE